MTTTTATPNTEEEINKLHTYLKTNKYTYIDVTKTMSMKTCMSYLHSIINSPTKVLYFWRTPQTDLLFSSVKDKKILINIAQDDDSTVPNIQFLNKDNQMSIRFTTFDESTKTHLSKFLSDPNLECDICYQPVKTSGYQCNNCDFFTCELCLSNSDQQTICQRCKQQNEIKL